MTSYERFIAICKQRGITASSAMIQAGLSKALATKWKQNQSIVPNGETLSKLSKFFNVPVDYFIGNGDDDPPPYRESPDVAYLAAAMRNMTPEQRKEVIHYAEYICPHAFDTKGD